jgi:glycosidase
VLASADHDFSRLAAGTRTAEQLGAAFTFLLTWGSVPSIYYGDEIGMRNVLGLPDHEGSICHPGYNRAACRTPMQWDETRPNAGFSDAPASALYLPQDPSPDRPTVAAQEDDPASTLNVVRRLIALRREVPALGTGARARVLTRDYPFAYLRGDRHLVVINPRREPAAAEVDAASPAARPLEVSGVRIGDGRVEADSFGYGVFDLADRSQRS